MDLDTYPRRIHRHFTRKELCHGSFLEMNEILISQAGSTVYEKTCCFNPCRHVCEEILNGAEFGYGLPKLITLLRILYGYV